jgi:predicted nucleic acid-binding protein
VLSKIDKLDLLNVVFGSITTTVEIAEEYGKALPQGVIINRVRHTKSQDLLELQIDKGESSAIA